MGTHTKSIQNVNRILQRMRYCGGTFSGKKSIVCMEEIEVLGHVRGRLSLWKNNPEAKSITSWGLTQLHYSRYTYKHVPTMRTAG